jgi:DNA-binding transcriptional MerR regulator/quercetin dioxygenase-like cupin family protein
VVHAVGDDGLGGLELLGVTEAAELVGVSPSTLRLWERQGLIEPVRSSGGARRYDRAMVDRLRVIARLRRVEGWNAAAIRRHLVTGGLEAATAPDGHGPSAPAGDGGPSGSAATTGTTGTTGTTTAAGSGIGSADELGRRLRRLRQRRRFTLREAAARSGLSISFVSAVERGLSGISVAALRRLLGAYETTLAELGAETDVETRAPAGPRRLVRAGERPVLETGGVRIEDLAVGASVLEPQLFVLAPGTTSEGTYSHLGEEFMFVLDGRLGVWLDEAEYYELGPGDALTFPSSLPHRFAALGPSTTRLVWVNSPPSF